MPQQRHTPTNSLAFMSLLVGSGARAPGAQSCHSVFAGMIVGAATARPPTPEE